MTLVIGDLDNFKAYNDYYGHFQGDICLKKVASLWKDSARRASDLAARIGGEEFALILTETSPETVMEILESFKSRLGNSRIEHKNSGVSKFVTMSMGAASCIPQRGKSPTELFKLADKRLYEAKKAGRNMIIYSDKTP